MLSSVTGEIKEKALTTHSALYKSSRAAHAARLFRYTAEFYFLHRQLLLCSLFTEDENDDEICRREHRADYVCRRPGQTEADLLVHDERAGNEGIEHAGDHRDPGILALAVAEHPDSNAREREQSKSLIGPCEIAPKGVEAVGVELCPDKNARDEGENDG